MKHMKLDDLQVVSKVHPDTENVELSREERLERWAVLLEKAPGRRLSTLRGTEHEFASERDRMSACGSPLSVAFEDPVLRGAGLAGETYGDAKRFFELDDWQLHSIVCHCHFGASMSAATAASCVRATMNRASGPGIFVRLARLLMGTARYAG